MKRHTLDDVIARTADAHSITSTSSHKNALIDYIHPQSGSVPDFVPAAENRAHSTARAPLARLGLFLPLLPEDMEEDL